MSEKSSNKFLNNTDAYTSGSRKSKLESVDSHSSKGLTSQISGRLLRVASLNSSRNIDDSASISDIDPSPARVVREKKPRSLRNINDVKEVPPFPRDELRSGSDSVSLQVSKLSKLEPASIMAVGASYFESTSQNNSVLSAVPSSEDQRQKSEETRYSGPGVQSNNISLRPGASNSTRGQNQIPHSLVRAIAKERLQQQAAREAAANGTATTMGSILSELNPFSTYLDTIHSFQVMNESPFSSWTKGEMILVIVYEGFHIYDEADVSRISLQEFMDELFPVEEGIPVKRGYTEDEWDIIDRGISRLQAIWIDYKYMTREKFKFDPSYQGFDPINLRTYDFDFSREILDWEQLDDEEMSETDVSPVSLRFTPTPGIQPKSILALDGDTTPGREAGTSDLRVTPTQRVGNIQAKRKSLRSTPGPGGVGLTGAELDTDRDPGASDTSSPGKVLLATSPRVTDMRTSRQRELRKSPAPIPPGQDGLTELIMPDASNSTPGELAVFGSSPRYIATPASSVTKRRRSSIRVHKHRNSIIKRRFDDAQKIRQIIETPWVSPDHDAAFRSLDFMHPRKGGKGGDEFELFDATTGRYCMLGCLGEQCDLWEEGQISEFSVFGPGVTNYFKFIKFMLWILMSIFVITLPVLVINTVGANFSQGLLSLADTTVGNLQNLSNSTTFISTPFVSLAGQYVTFGRQSVGIFYMATDIIVVCLVLCAFIWLKMYEIHEEKIVNKTSVYPSQFTIEVNNLPEESDEVTLRMQLKEYFNKTLKSKFDIADIDFAYDNATEIRDCRERGQLIKLKIALVNRYRYNATIIRNGAEVPFLNREPAVAKIRKEFYSDMKVIDSRMKSYDDALQRLESMQGKREGDVPKVAYIVFNDAVGAATAVKMFRPTVFDLFNDDPNLYFRGKRLEVNTAPEPNTIIWETVMTPYWTRIKRQTITTAVALSLVLVSYFITFSALVAMQSYTQQNQQCPLGFYQLSIPQQQNLVNQNSDNLHCYCDQFSTSSQATNSLCQTYVTKSTQVQVMLFFAAVVVLLVNTFIEYVFDFFSDFEKHRTEIDKERSIFIRLFVLKYINTACLFLLVSDQHFIQHAVSATYSSSVDMTLSWYQSVGVIIMLTTILNIAFMQIPNVLHYCEYLYRIHKEKSATLPTAFTQVDLNKLYVGPQMPFAYRYAQIVSLFFVILTFNTGMPILNLIGSVNFVVFYFVEKYLFIHFYRTPFRFTSEISKMATMLLPVAVAIHLGMSIWTLSNENIFSSNPDSLAPAYLSNSVTSQKIGYPQTQPLFIIFCIVISVLGVYMIAKEVEVRYFQLNAWIAGEDRDFFLGARKSISHGIGFAAFVNGGFLRAVQRNLIKELASYSILKNPKYKELFGISWEFAAKNKRLSAIRKSITKISQNFEINADDLSDALEGENKSIQDVLRQRRMSIDEVTPFDAVINPYDTEEGEPLNSPLSKMRRSPSPARRFSGVRETIRKQFSENFSDVVNPYTVPSPSEDTAGFELAYPTPASTEETSLVHESTISKVIRRFSLTQANSPGKTNRSIGDASPTFDTLYTPVSTQEADKDKRRGSAPGGVNTNSPTHNETSPRVIAAESAEGIRSLSDRPLRSSKNLDSYLSSKSPESILQSRSPVPAPRRHSGVESDYDRNLKLRQSSERSIDLSGVRIESLSNRHNRLDAQSNPHVNELRASSKKVITAPSLRSSGPLRSSAKESSGKPASASEAVVRDSYSSNTGGFAIPSSRDRQTGEHYDNIWTCYTDSNGKTYWRSIVDGDVCFHHPSQLDAKQSSPVDL